MFQQDKFKSLFILLLSLSLVNTSFASTNPIMSPMELIENKQTKQKETKNSKELIEVLKSKELQLRLAEFGISPEEAQERINNLSPEELKAMESQMQEMKAGAGILELVLVVLMIIYFAQRI